MNVANLTQHAGILARDPEFIRFVGDLASCEVTAEDAAELIRLACRVDSRRELNTDAGAAVRFNREIRAPFRAWKLKQQEKAA